MTGDSRGNCRREAGAGAFAVTPPPSSARGVRRRKRRRKRCARSLPLARNLQETTAAPVYSRPPCGRKFSRAARRTISDRRAPANGAGNATWRHCAFAWCFVAGIDRIMVLRSALCAIGSCATNPTKPWGRSEMSGPLSHLLAASATANLRRVARLLRGVTGVGIAVRFVPAGSWSRAVMRRHLRRSQRRRCLRSAGTHPSSRMRLDL